MEEAELVRKMISGDKDAFAGLMEIYQKQALRAAYLISGNYADSEDIVQETFTSCYINRKQIRDPEAFKGWFYKTLSRTAWKESAGRPDGNSLQRKCIRRKKRLRAGF